jgi:hypothetical protein
LGRVAQRVSSYRHFVGDPARFDYLSARLSNPASQVR